MLDQCIVFYDVYVQRYQQKHFFYKFEQLLR